MGLLDKLKGLFSKSKESDSLEEQAKNNQVSKEAANAQESKDSNETAEAAPTGKMRMKDRIAQHQANVQKVQEMKAARAATLAAAKEKLAAREAQKGAEAATSGKENDNAEEGAKSKVKATEVADSGVSILEERLQMERRFISQPKEHRIRVTKDTPITLGDFLAKVFEIPAENIQEMYVVTDDLKGKDIRPIENPAQYDMMSDFITITDDDCQPKGEGRNVMLSIIFNDGPFQRMSVHMYCDGTYGKNAQLLVKLSFMVVKDNNDVEWDFAYLTFDMELPEKLLQQIEKIKKSAADKYNRGIRLDVQEKTILHIPDVGAEKVKAEEFIKEGRYGDAVSILTRVFKFIKPMLSSNEINESVVTFAKHLCIQLAICYTHLGLFDMALYWAELSYSFRKDDIKLLATASLNAKDIRVLELFKIQDPKQFGFYPGSPYIEPYKMGIVLNKCFHVLPSELSHMVIVKDDDPTQIEVMEGIENIWTFDFIDKMKKLESMTAYISYRSDREKLERLKAVRQANDEAQAGANTEAENDSENQAEAGEKKKVSPASKKTSIYQFVDLSKDRTDNEIIINFSKRYRSRAEFINMEVMVPEFKHSENNNNGNPMVKDFLFYTKEYFSMEDFEETRQEAREKDAKGEDLSADEQYANGELIDARFNMIMGRAAGDNKAWGDALYYLYKAQQLFAYEYLSGNEDGNSVELIQELCYRLGYIFSMNKLYEQALGFLMRNRGEMVSKYQVELVNGLCNGQDYRAFNYIKTMLDDIMSDLSPDEYPDKTTQTFLSFLKRRMAYLLIEKGQLKKAESMLETMLNEDKRTRDFAEFELQYIQDKAIFDQNQAEAKKAKNDEPKKETDTEA